MRRTLTKTTTATATIAATLLLAMTAPSMFVRADDAATFSELISLNSTHNDGRSEHQHAG